MKATSEKINKTVHTVHFGEKDVERTLAEEACRVLGLPHDVKGIVSVSIHDKKEDSPFYRSWKEAHVVITIPVEEADKIEDTF